MFKILVESRMPRDERERRIQMYNVLKAIRKQGAPITAIEEVCAGMLIAEWYTSKRRWWNKPGPAQIRRVSKQIVRGAEADRWPIVDLTKTRTIEVRYTHPPIQIPILVDRI